MSDIETVSTVKLRTDMHRLISEVEYQGKRVIITRNGKPMAALVPVEVLELLLAGERLGLLQAEDDSIRIDARDFLKSMKGDQ